MAGRSCKAILAAALGAATLVAAPVARADQVAVVVVPPTAHPAAGAHGLMVPGAGSRVSRRDSLAALVRGRVHDAHLGNFHPERPKIALARRPAEITIYVSLPPEGEFPNDRRYPVTIVGGGYRGLLMSDGTRIPGLLSVADIAPTAQALEDGDDPVISWRESDEPEEELARLDARLDDSEATQLPATITLVLLLIDAFVLTLVTRAPLAARTGLLIAPAAIAVSVALSAADVADPILVTVALVAAAPAVAVGAAALLRSEAALGRSLVAFLGAYALVLAVAPETNAFAAIGPQPWSGGRFYGVTNLVETLLLVPALAAGALLAPVLLLPVALLTLVTVGGSDTGADGGGILVVTAGFIALALRLSEAPLTRRRVAVATAAALAAGLAFVGIDAAAGGSSHVVDAVGSGSDLFGELSRRARLSFEIATQGVGSVLALAAGVAGLVFFATRRPRYATVDALLVAIAVSLAVNDAPTRVAGFGAFVCANLWAWARFGRTRHAE